MFFLTNLNSMHMKRNNLNYFKHFKIMLYSWIVLVNIAIQGIYIWNF